MSTQIDLSRVLQFIDAYGPYYPVKRGGPHWAEAEKYDVNGNGIIDVDDYKKLKAQVAESLDTAPSVPSVLDLLPVPEKPQEEPRNDFPIILPTPVTPPLEFKPEKIPIEQPPVVSGGSVIVKPSAPIQEQPPVVEKPITIFNEPTPPPPVVMTPSPTYEQPPVVSAPTTPTTPQSTSVVLNLQNGDPGESVSDVLSLIKSSAGAYPGPVVYEGPPAAGQAPVNVTVTSATPASLPVEQSNILPVVALAAAGFFLFSR